MFGFNLPRLGSSMIALTIFVVLIWAEHLTHHRYNRLLHCPSIPCFHLLHHLLPYHIPTKIPMVWLSTFSVWELRRWLPPSKSMYVFRPQVVKQAQTWAQICICCFNSSSAAALSRKIGPPIPTGNIAFVSLPLSHRPGPRHNQFSKGIQSVVEP